MTRQLVRSSTNRTVFGVCGGLAEYFNVDPTLVRIAFVLTALLGGPGVLVYLIATVVMPSRPALPASSTAPLAY